MKPIKVVEVAWGNHSVGRLALTSQGLCAFEYAPEQIASGISISPFELPIRPGVVMNIDIRC